MLRMRFLRFAMAVLAIMLLSTAQVSAGIFTRTSPINGGTLLPAAVTEVGGVVFQLEGLNGTIVTSQLAASSLFSGFFNAGTPVAFQGNPGTIGIQTGFSPMVLAALGGGIDEAAVRITLDDGDTGIGDFDENQNFLLLNGVDFGAASNFTGVLAQETSGDGLTELDPPDPGFDDNDLETGFFHFTDPVLLVSLFNTMTLSNEVVFGLRDDSVPFDNFFDFTGGVDGGLIDVGTGPIVGTVPEPTTLAIWSMIGLTGFVGRRRRDRTT